MDESSHTRNDATPESAAITGGVSPAAEPPPTTRGRRSAAEGSTWLSLLLGVVLILTALIADQDSGPALGMAIAGGALIVIGIASLAGVLGAVAIAVLGFGASVVFTVLAFTSGAFRFPELVLLVAGAAMFISSFASLAASRRPGGGADEPQPGVENV